MVFVLALLAVLISYEYDIECLMESQACHEIVQGEKLADCTQPSLPSAATGAFVAILPSHTPVTAPPPSIVVTEEAPWSVQALPLVVFQGPPLGLRAPPCLVG